MRLLSLLLSRSLLGFGDFFLLPFRRGKLQPQTTPPNPKALTGFSFLLQFDFFFAGCFINTAKETQLNKLLVEDLRCRKE